MSIKNQIATIQSELSHSGANLIAVSKTKPINLIMEAYDLGQRAFGENKVQELVEKYEQMPKDIEWHMIGHLQRNKVKYIAPFVQLIHGVDTLKLLRTINKEGVKNNRIISCLLQVHIAQEESKFGFSKTEIVDFLNSQELDNLQNISIIGLMGMATNTTETSKVAAEFSGLYSFFEELKTQSNHSQLDLKELSMGMSNDYKIAIESGSTMVRIGSTIFGARN
ncbi:MAG: YggS family pyridoxal phosphate-dependent enzyme [Reichenbachiella sp.]